MLISKLDMLLGRDAETWEIISIPAFLNYRNRKCKTDVLHLVSTLHFLSWLALYQLDRAVLVTSLHMQHRKGNDSFETFFSHVR